MFLREIPSYMQELEAMQSLSRKRVLVTNDDGILADGIRCLIEALEPFCDVWVVAPDREQSAKSHALTLDNPLRLKKLGKQRFGVDGTPADSVYLGIHHVLEGKVDLVVSGINHGANLGDDVAYSGTVSAAMEAVFLGVPAFAVSIVGSRPYDFSLAASFSASLTRHLLSSSGLDSSLLNVNVPNIPADELMGVRSTCIGHRHYGNSVEEKVDPRGRHYYWIGGPDIGFKDLEGSDCNAIRDRCISVTPLTTDFTDYGRLSGLKWVEDFFSYKS